MANLNVDHTKEFLSFISFCTGYGGIEIGVERSLAPIPLKALSFLEVEAFAIANLVAKMEEGLLAPAPIWTDLKTFHAYAFRGLVDILMAGYPCQPFSNAGKRKGKEDPRHLWPWIKEHIKAFLPTVCLFENVPGHVSLGLREVLTDLAELGYRMDNDSGEITVGIFSAEECGAPHRRERLFILAYRECSERWPHIKKAIEQNWANRGWEETPGWARTCCPALADTDGPRGSFRGEDGRMGWQPESGQKLADPGGSESNRLSEPAGRVKDRAAGFSGLNLVNTNGQGMERRRSERGSQQVCPEGEAVCGSQALWVSRPGEPQHWWEEPRLLAHAKDADRGAREKAIETETGIRRDRPADESERPNECQLGRTAYGASGGVDPVANRVDRLRLCGNGVYPDTAEKAFYTLMNKVINPNTAYIQPSIQLEMFA